MRRVTGRRRTAILTNVRSERRNPTCAWLLHRGKHVSKPKRALQEPRRNLSKSLSLSLYIYIYIERERERENTKQIPKPKPTMKPTVNNRKRPEKSYDDTAKTTTTLIKLSNPHRTLLKPYKPPIEPVQNTTKFARNPHRTLMKPLYQSDEVSPEGPVGRGILDVLRRPMGRRRRACRTQGSRNFLGLGLGFRTFWVEG